MASSHSTTASDLGCLDLRLKRKAVNGSLVRPVPPVASHRRRHSTRSLTSPRKWANTSCSASQPLLVVIRALLATFRQKSLARRGRR